MRKLVRIVDGKEIDISTTLDFKDSKGNRHPRNVLWLWSDEELWTILQIREPQEYTNDVPTSTTEL